ncbi:multiubiquitin domain-containing protein [Bradyrhizobium barranii]|uniref:Multiubiquitin domain-containing protein n=1 Tax=Bradyrhizobium barranii TaxID=2992140 RepID=A0ABY3QWR0_9BRAD|nr:multiubiquitin domain-containing protein [Bradyrhizobium japonicum]UFW90475.1 multiubiquitin domain-containing protein [Bradyrhizobium japonicum]
MENAVTGGEGRNTGGAGQVEARVVGPDGQFFTSVNGETVKFANPDPKGEHILEKAGFQPAGDYALIQLLGHSSRSIGLDDTVDLRAAGTELFRAFKTDRLYRFTLNGHGYEWGADKLSENELRVIGHVPGDDVIVLEREGADIVLNPADVLDLAHGGTEHLYTEKRLITVFYENEPREIPRGTYTTEELKKLFGVQEGYVLEVINHEGHLTPLKPGAKLRVKEGMKFFEQVPCGASS